MTDKNICGGVNDRKSSLELLKIIATFMVVLSHSMPNNGRFDFASDIDLGQATTNIQYLIAYLFNNCGQIGNCIFISISAYFLLESEKIKLKKIFHMIGDTYFITVLMIVIFALFDKNLTIGYIAKFFIPFGAGLNWFITAYVLLYLMHPALNMVIKELSARNLFIVNIVFVFLYNVVSLLMGRTAYFNNNLIDFIGIYFLVGFTKKLLNKDKYIFVGEKLLIIGTIGWLASVMIFELLGSFIPLIKGRMHSINHFSNPFFICIGIGIVLIALNRNFYSGFINYFSSMSLLIYVIHAHRYVIDFVRFRVFDYILEQYTFRNLWLWIILYAIIAFTVTSIIAFLYKALVQKWVYKISELLCEFIKRMYLFRTPSGSMTSCCVKQRIENFFLR